MEKISNYGKRKQVVTDNHFEGLVEATSFTNNIVISLSLNGPRQANLVLMRAAKVQANLRIRAVSPEPPLLAHTSSESRGTFRQKARSLAPLNGWACAVKICHDGMLENTNSFDGAQMKTILLCLAWCDLSFFLLFCFALFRFQFPPKLPCITLLCFTGITLSRLTSPCLLPVPGILSSC